MRAVCFCDVAVDPVKSRLAKLADVQDGSRTASHDGPLSTLSRPWWTGPGRAQFPGPHSRSVPLQHRGYRIRR